MSLATQAPMRKCGRRWATQQAAESSKRFLAGGLEASPCLYGCGGYHLSEVKGAPRGRSPKAAAGTGFPPAVKLMIRTRAGHGNPEDAHCEWCGIWQGLHLGQCHHRQNRQMGGSRLRNTVQNGGLLCGTPLDLTTCHGLATALDEHLAGGGWVLKSGQDPLLVSVMLAGGLGSGIAPVWLTADGGYSFDPPQALEAS